jgi:hypothetical protein
VRGPAFFANQAPRERPAGVLHEHFEKRKFPTGQIDRVSGKVDRSANEIQFDPAMLQDRFFDCGLAPQ